MRERFSQRSAQVDAKVTELIERWSAEHDGADPEPRVIAQLERAAALASRPDKTHGLDAATVHADWRRDALRAGFDPELLAGDALGQRSLPFDASSEDEVVTEALCRVSEESSTWLRADIARHVATLLPTTTAASSGALVGEMDRLAELASMAATVQL